MGEKELKVWKFIAYTILILEIILFVLSIIQGDWKFVLLDGVIIINICFCITNVDRSFELLKKEIALKNLLDKHLGPVLKEVAESMKDPEFFKGDGTKEITVHVKEDE